MSNRKILIVFLLILSSLFLGYGIVLITAKNVPSIALSRNALTAAAEHAAGAANDALIVEPQDGMTPLLTLIQNASSSIDLVMYELSDPKVEQALSDAEKRGVSVRVLLNQGYYGVPSKSNPNETAYEHLQSDNVPVRWTSAAFALTHEKSLITDGTQALIMTFNLIPKEYATSRDFGIIDDDAADVRAMSTTFDDDWNGDELSATFGDDLVWSPDSESSLLSVIQGAHKSLEIYNEEMSDSDIVQALIDARKRGVSVKIVMTYSSLWKKEFTKLASAGVEIRTYSSSKKASLYIHAKAIVADDRYVFLGSENFSSTSLLKSRELGLVISNQTIAAAINATFQTDWADAKPFTVSN